MKRKHTRDNGEFHFKVELIKANQKTGCVFTLVNKRTAAIKRVIRPNANAFWVDAARYDLYAVNFDNAEFTTTYKFFPFGRSGRWELMAFQGMDFQPRRSNSFRGKYVGAKRGPSRIRRKKAWQERQANHSPEVSPPAQATA